MKRSFYSENSYDTVHSFDTFEISFVLPLILLTGWADGNLKSNGKHSR